MVNNHDSERVVEMNKRKSAQSSLRRISDRIKSPQIDVWDDIQLSNEMDMLNGFWAQYVAAHETLVSISMDETEIDVHDDAMAVQADIYSEAKVTLRRRIVDIERATANQQNSMIQNGEFNGGRTAVSTLTNTDEVNRFLEKIKVPRFNGEQHKWLAFYSSFKSMVHDKNFSNIEKFHYLFYSLTERARNVIGGLDTADSYEEAWATLVKRYDNKRVIVNAHLQHFVGFQLQNRPGSNELLSLVDVTRLTIRSLRTLQVPVDEWDAILVYLISRKLDERTRDFWESEQNSTDIPRLKDMLDCIENRARTLQLAEESKGTVKPSTNNENQRQGKRQAVAVHNTTVVSTNGATTSNQANCSLCKQDHWTNRCPQFNNKSPFERYELIKGIPNICFNCLRIGHIKRDCQSSGCRNCPGNERHNTILCRRNAPLTGTTQSAITSTAQSN